MVSILPTLPVSELPFSIISKPNENAEKRGGGEREEGF